MKFTHIKRYDLKKYNFYKILSDKFAVKKLEKLHLELLESDILEDGIASLGKDTHSIFHEIFYQNMKSDWTEFHQTWKNFIYEVIKPLFPNEKKLICQAYPSFRIQYPNSKAIPCQHYDSDENHKHPYGEINITIPITDMRDTNAVWKESLPGFCDYSPMNLKKGQIALWDGNKCAHFNKVNISDNTRISFDIRVIPRKFYIPNYEKQTATVKKRFIIGEYYEEF